MQQLPPHLVERTRVVEGDGEPVRGSFVLYWLGHAMRANENPALDVAVWIGNRLQLPVLVYQELSERSPYASDRHHMFVLQGARDLGAQFSRRGITYAFHLETRKHRAGQLLELARRAAVVVTEDLPIEETRRASAELASAAAAPLMCVDTACVVPARLVGRAYERAFEYRNATKHLYESRLDRVWEDVEPNLRGCRLDLSFQPLDFEQIDLAEAIGDCDIDHAVAPVTHCLGGSAAGYARWESFRRERLDQYHATRNDPLVDGTSRLSPYLHYGMVSPLRIAREAAASHAAGAAKFLDELLIWREMAYAFCHFRRDHESLAALPDWARETLAAHASDVREAYLSWESLARGRSGDRLWDAAQQALLKQGELHNNLRMTWGKALLRWTPDPQSALATLIDLNHRYALDGRDPASYGGILWCLGQFDRPFSPSRPIFGTVRQRSTEHHRQRLDTERYEALVTRTPPHYRKRVAIVGAGISGLACARALADHGFAVTVFEKSRGAGGRMATRRTPGDLPFDHGAQYFTVRDPRFARYVRSWLSDGIVAAWEARIASLAGGRVVWVEETTSRYVGVPGMNAICRRLAADLKIVLGKRVDPPRRHSDHWGLCTENGEHLGEFDYFVTSAPAPQSAELLACVPSLRDVASRTEMRGCWAAMLGFDDALDLPFDAAFVQDSPLSWIARNNSKPSRAGAESWVLHAGPEWTGQWLEIAAETAIGHLLQAFWEATAVAPRQPSFATAHRWRYSIPTEPLDRQYLFDPHLKAGACGDWCHGGRVEGAFLSGSALAGALLRSTAISDSPAVAKAH